jgi:hypothetical protein
LDKGSPLATPYKNCAGTNVELALPHEARVIELPIAANVAEFLIKSRLLMFDINPILLKLTCELYGVNMYQ